MFLFFYGINFGDTDVDTALHKGNILEHLDEVLDGVTELLPNGQLWRHKNNSCLPTDFKDFDQRKLVENLLNEAFGVFEAWIIDSHLLGANLVDKWHDGLWGVVFVPDIRLLSLQLLDI